MFKGLDKAARVLVIFWSFGDIFNYHFNFQLFVSTHKICEILDRWYKSLLSWWWKYKPIASYKVFPRLAL